MRRLYTQTSSRARAAVPVVAWVGFVRWREIPAPELKSLRRAKAGHGSHWRKPAPPGRQLGPFPAFLTRRQPV